MAIADCAQNFHLLCKRFFSKRPFYTVGTDAVLMDDQSWTDPVHKQRDSFLGRILKRDHHGYIL
jgi:hypothetical protein